jgi:septum formation protein
VVISKGRIIGKPKDEKHARDMLREFSGSEIKVVTGVYVCFKNKAKGGTCQSSIRVAALDKKTQDKLFPHLEPYDKAGGFSIEGVGSIIFDDIRGSYFNILGLPMNLLFELTQKLKVDLIS